MCAKLLNRTSTLKFKLPNRIFLPEFEERIRVKKTILRTIIKTLKISELEMLFVGSLHDYGIEYIDIPPLENSIIVSVNILNDTKFDFNTSQNLLLRRFKKELQSNNEHIVIDKTTLNDGIESRFIEIYINSSIPEKLAPNLPFSTSSNTYTFYQSI